LIKDNKCGGKMLRINSEVFRQNISDAAKALPTKRGWQSIFKKAKERLREKVRPCGFRLYLVQKYIHRKIL